MTCRYAKRVNFRSRHHKLRIITGERIGVGGIDGLTFVVCAAAFSLSLEALLISVPPQVVVVGLFRETILVVVAASDRRPWEISPYAEGIKQMTLPVFQHH